MRGYKLDKPSFTQARERGAVEFGTRIAERESIMSIAAKEVVTIPPTMTIKGAAETMTKYGFRRLPVADPGTNRLLGIIGSSDIIDFLGGGRKFQIIQKKYRGNFLAAINESVREIMVTDVLTVDKDASIKEVLNLIIKTRIGGVVVVDRDKKVLGIITERDLAFLLADKLTGKKVEEYMTKKVVTASPKTTLGEAARIMTKNSFRRLPVVSDGKLVGMLTTRMIIDFIGRNNIFAKIVENRVDEVLKTKCEEIMKTRVATVTKDMDLGEAARVIKDEGVGTVCVVDNDKLAGILTERDLVLALA
ncbi:MAG: CBS domain-containing protein [Euryarchaeota archaeon]|nr:CBS domain-containing protein [Euryarchaeota archaeon]